jgi:hypothetical protein
MPRFPVSTASVLSAVPCILLLPACRHTEYEVDVRPTANTVERSLVVWEAEGSKDLRASEAVIERVAALYPRRDSTPSEARQRFSGVFPNGLPADLGAPGMVETIRTRFGTVHAYLERPSGQLHTAAAIDELRAGAARLAEFVRGWCRAELGATPGFDALDRFLEAELRRDLEDIFLTIWVIAAASSPSGEPEREDEERRYHDLVARLAQILIERGYLKPGDIPRLIRQDSAKDGSALREHAARFIARKLGVDEAAASPDSLAIFVDPARLEASWRGFLETTPEFQELDRKRRATEGKTDPIEVSDVLLEASGVSRLYIDLDPLGVGSRLTLRVHAETAPVFTNGEWDGAGKVVRFRRRSLERSFPSILYAVWSVPDAESQKAKLGKVALEGQSLIDYGTWYAGLKASERSAWDSLVEGLRGDAESWQRIAEFRFIAERESETSALSDAVREILDVEEHGPKR